MELAYLNHAATSYPKPPAVLDEVARVLRRPPFDVGRGGIGPDLVEEVRLVLAKELGLDDPAELRFNSGATAGLNTVIRGLDLGGRHVVGTVLAHNAILRPLARLGEEEGADIQLVDPGPGRVEDAVCEAIRSDTALVAIQHGSNVTGAIHDVARVARAAHAVGARLLVDASQTMGPEPVSLPALGADFLAFSGHKGLLGLTGTGVLVARAPLAPLMLGGGWEDGTGEAGTLNHVGIVSMGAGLAWLRSAEGMASTSRARTLHAELLSGLRTIPGVQLIGPGGPLTLVSFVIDGLESEDVGHMLLESFGLVVRAGQHCAPLLHELAGHPSSVRISLGPTSGDGDVGRALRAVAAISKAAAG